MPCAVSVDISPLMRTRSRMVKEIESRISARLPPTSRWTFIAVTTKSRSTGDAPGQVGQGGLHGQPKLHFLHHPPEFGGNRRRQFFAYGLQRLHDAIAGAQAIDDQIKAIRIFFVLSSAWLRLVLLPRPAPVSSTARTEVSAASSSQHCFSSPIILRDTALSRSGAFRVSVARPSVLGDLDLLVGHLSRLSTSGEVGRRAWRGRPRRLP